MQHHDSESNARQRRSEKAVATAAYLKCQAHTEVEIAKILTVTQPTVSRYLTEARKKGWLEITLIEKLIPAGLLSDVKAEVHGADDLREKIARWTGREIPVRVFHSGNEELASVEGYRERLDRFGRAVAPSILELIPDMQKTGVAWGRTLRGLVDALDEEHKNAARRKAEGLEFLPVVGEPLNHPTAECGASRLVADLHRWAGCAGDPHCMDSVAACIPHSQVENQAAVLSFFCEVRTYEKVFGDPKKRNKTRPLIKMLNCLLTSVGTRHLQDDWIVDAAEAAKMTVTELDEITYGNISGVFLPKHRISPTANKLITQINERATGIKLENIQACAAKNPGVVVLAIGKGKAQIIRESLIQKAITRLFLDQELKDELLKFD